MQSFSTSVYEGLHGEVHVHPNAFCIRVDKLPDLPQLLLANLILYLTRALRVFLIYKVDPVVRVSVRMYYLWYSDRENKYIGFGEPLRNTVIL